MLTGTMTLNTNTKTFTAAVSSVYFDISNLTIVANSFKAEDNHPDFQICVRTPRGKDLRIGSMWKAVSETTGNTYYSIVLTDRSGRIWRMNAVRNDKIPENTWQIIPMIAMKTENIAVNGSLEILDDGAIAGSIGSYDFDMDFVAVENLHKGDENHPDWHIEVKSPAGRPIRIGAIWKAVSERSGNAYLSLAFHSPQGGSHRANAVRRSEDAAIYEIIPLARAELNAA